MEYVGLHSTPFLKRLEKKGCFIEGSPMALSVTNINNVSILIGTYPKTHEITTNYYFDGKTRKEVYMDSFKYIKVRTILEQGVKRSKKTAILAS